MDAFSCISVSLLVVFSSFTTTVVAGIRAFLIWVSCVAFIILVLDNFLLWQPNNTRKSADKGSDI